MATHRDDLDRRRFLRLVTAAALTVAAGESAAAELPHVDPKDPTASALGYVEDTTKVDEKKFPQHKPTQKCGNCKLFTKQDGQEYGPCQLFPGKAVNEQGWCSGYQAKA
jgi:Rieske Fe-S protein